MPSSGSSSRIASRKPICGPIASASRARHAACRSPSPPGATGACCCAARQFVDQPRAGSAWHRRSTRPRACEGAPAPPGRHRRGSPRDRGRCPIAGAGSACGCRPPSTTSASAHSSRPSGSVTLNGIAAVEHAAAAAIAEHRRLQHRREFGDFGRRILRAAAAQDHRPLGSAEPLRRPPDRVVVDFRRRDGARSRNRHAGPRLPQTSIEHSQRRRTRPAGRHRAQRLRGQARRILRRGGCARSDRPAAR